MNTSSAAATAYNRDAFVKATADDARSSPRSASVAQDHAYEDGPATAVVERGDGKKGIAAFDVESTDYVPGSKPQRNGMSDGNSGGSTIYIILADCDQNDVW